MYSLVSCLSSSVSCIFLNLIKTIIFVFIVFVCILFYYYFPSNYCLLSSKDIWKLVLFIHNTSLTYMLRKDLNQTKFCCLRYVLAFSNLQSYISVSLLHLFIINTQLSTIIEIKSKIF